MLSESHRPLPSETWGKIMSYLYHGDLFFASTVCHTWHRMALPHLYRVIHVTKASHFEQLSKRITTDGDDSAIPVANYVRELEIFMISEVYIPYVSNILRVVSYLEHFAWRASYLPWKDTITMDTLRTKCPKLNSLYVNIEDEYGDNWDSDHITAVFKLRSLKHVCIVVCEVGKFEGKCVELFASLLRACPDLRTLSLYLSKDTIENRWSLSRLCAQLEDITFQSLRSLRIDGNLVSTMDGDTDAPVRSFFARHPGIRELAIMSNQPDQLSYDLRNIKGAFRSLLRFEGPAALCQEIISQSSLQLESLYIIYVGDGRDEYIEKDGSGSFYALQRLPALRELVLEFAGDGLGYDNRVIKSLFKDIFEMLEKINIKFETVDLHTEDIIHALKFSPNLRYLEIETSDPDYLKMCPGGQDWVACMRTFEVLCPKLESIQSFYHGKVSRGCDTVEWPDGAIW